MILRLKTQVSIKAKLLSHKHTGAGKEPRQPKICIKQTHNLKHVNTFVHSPPVLSALAPNLTNTTHKWHEIRGAELRRAELFFSRLIWLHNPPVRRSLDRTGRTPCRPPCNGRPLSVRYWEAAAQGTNPNLLLRTESQHTSVDSNHSSAQRDSSQSDSASRCWTPAVYWWSHFRFICERGKWEEL